MTTKNQELKNIIKISSKGGFLLRRERTNTISITRVRDELVLETEKRDIKPLYFDELSAQLFMTSPEYTQGIFPLKCDRGQIEVLCGQDECALYVVGESQPISVLPPTQIHPKVVHSHHVHHVLNNVMMEPVLHATHHQYHARVEVKMGWQHFSQTVHRTRVVRHAHVRVEGVHHVM